MFSDRFSDLPAYAFPRLRALLDHHAPGGSARHMTIGEPRHAFPDFVGNVLAQHVHEFNRYPPNEGAPELLEAIGKWLTRRFEVTVDADRQVMALNGTREGLYNAGMALVSSETAGKRSVVLIPNPFYQVYMIAAMSVAAEPVFVSATEATGYLPDYASLSPDILNRTAAAYICSPSNPQGAVASREYLDTLIQLAEKYDFQIFADECYSEIYRDVPPVGALSRAQALGADPERVVVFHSLSKRSNLPGLRSGFMAGGPETIARARQLRAYSGAPVPLPLQRVATAAWQDEDHVQANRALYQSKYRRADEIFDGVAGYSPPQAGFFLWLPVGNGEAAAVRLWTETGVRVLPGAYLAHQTETDTPCNDRIRVAMVDYEEDCVQGLQMIRSTLFGD
jgi:N-succinyldiaminopimelate aminotransferase